MAPTHKSSWRRQQTDTPGAEDILPSPPSAPPEEGGAAPIDAGPSTPDPPAAEAPAPEPLSSTPANPDTPVPEAPAPDPVPSTPNSDTPVPEAPAPEPVPSIPAGEGETAPQPPADQTGSNGAVPGPPPTQDEQPQTEPNPTPPVVPEIPQSQTPPVPTPATSAIEGTDVGIPVTEVTPPASTSQIPPPPQPTSSIPAADPVSSSQPDLPPVISSVSEPAATVIDPSPSQPQTESNPAPTVVPEISQNQIAPVPTPAATLTGDGSEGVPVNSLVTGNLAASATVSGLPVDPALATARETLAAGDRDDDADEVVTSNRLRPSGGLARIVAPETTFETTIDVPITITSDGLTITTRTSLPTTIVSTLSDAPVVTGTTSSATSSSSSMGLMIGAVAGGIVFIVAVCLGIFCFRRARRNQKRTVQFDDMTPDPFPPSMHVPSFLKSPSTRYNDRGQRKRSKRTSSASMSEKSSSRRKSMLSVGDDPFADTTSQPIIRTGLSSRVKPPPIDDYSNPEPVHGGRVSVGPDLPNPFEDPLPNPTRPTSLSVSESAKRGSGISITSSNGGPLKMGMAV